MKTEEAIEFLDKKNRYVLPKTNLEIEHNDDVDEVIKILKRGEKFEKMWGELKQYCLVLERQSVLKEIIRLEQKYSPKGKGKYFYEATSKDPHLKKVNFPKGGSQ